MHVAAETQRVVAAGDVVVTIVPGSPELTYGEGAAGWAGDPLTVVNLFAGHQTWLRPFRERGHITWATDLVDRPGIDLAVDILDLRISDIPFQPDLVLASVDCTAFSVASIGTHWTGGLRGYIPATPKAHNRMALVHATVALIEALQPRWAVIENPRGMLRKLGILDRYERNTVWYCQYGDERAKPTDLWGLPFPDAWGPRPECRNGAADHAAAPRGAKTGTQGREKDERSFIPYELALSMMHACELDLVKGGR